MKRLIRISVYTLAGVLLWGSWAYAQRPAYYDHPDRFYRRGIDLFEKEKYGAAQQQFARAAGAYGNLRTELSSDARYYMALCAIRLFNNDAEALVNEYIRGNPESPRVNQICYQMALYEYQRKQYRRAIGWFEQVDRNRLDKDELPEYYFKKGYSYYRRGDPDRAGVAFSEIKDRDTEYTAPAIYYYAHIAYEQEHYLTALREFERLKNDETFGHIVPYYILQIYYLQEDYDQIIAIGPALLEKVVSGREDEVLRLVADAFYRKGLYAEAEKYMTRYMEKAKVLTEEERYQAGFIFYQNGKYDLAALEFEKIAGRKNAMGQNAAYHLADCYIRMGDRNKARMAFSSAARLDFDQEIQEDALFNAAKITYELSYSPFNEAIRAFQEYIERFPSSERIDEAYNYLVMAFQNTRNYKAALESLNRILVKNDRIRKAYQRVAFYRGLELFNNQEYEEAIDHFDLSLEHADKANDLKARALFWKAEAWSRLGDHDMAIRYYEEFLTSPGAFGLEEYDLCLYSMGYAWFEKENYAEAASWFRKFTASGRSGRNDLLADAFNRIGDTYFIRMQYATALEYYDQSLAIGMANPDYAMFQKAFTMGLMKDYAGKISVLEQLISKYPRSNYRDDAWFEQGNSYVNLQQYDQALAAYRKIIDDFSGSSYVARAKVKMGLVYYNLDRNDRAIELFKQVVEEYPGTSEARNALTGLKNIYVDQNEVDTYFAYARSVGEYADVSTAEKDSLTYLSGENLYMEGNCERAVQVLQNYLEEFPQGSFATNAYFYLAECLAEQNRQEEALRSYDEVISRPRNIFTEPALVEAASIAYRQKNYFDALEYYLIMEQVAERPANQTEALKGQLRCYYHLKNYARVNETGERLLQLTGLPEDMVRETHYKMARAYRETGKPEKALEHYRAISEDVSSVMGAEAKYRVAELYFETGEIDKAEAEIFSMIDMNTPHAYWMAKSFLLLGDVLVEKGDYFQARYTLQSLLDGYGRNDDGILEEAAEKLDKIINRDMFITPEDTLKPVNLF